MKKLLIFAGVAIVIILIYRHIKNRKLQAEAAEIASIDAAEQSAIQENATAMLPDTPKFLEGFENLGVSYDVVEDN